MQLTAAGATKIIVYTYSAFQIDELHRHNQSLVGTLYARSLLWSADMKTGFTQKTRLRQ